jgi:hypothetical protein
MILVTAITGIKMFKCLFNGRQNYNLSEEKSHGKKPY